MADIPAELQLNVGGAKINQIYKRLEAKKPSYTITGSGGGGMASAAGERALTNRGALLVFRRSLAAFKFKGGKESVRKQIGMAVPVEGARIVFEAVPSYVRAYPLRGDRAQPAAYRAGSSR